MEQQTATPPIGRRTTARGIRATARALGVSPSHLSQVVSGKRRSLRLERRLAALGVKVAKGAAS